MNKYLIGAFVVALAVVAYVGVKYPLAIPMVNSGSPTGSTFNTAKVAEVVMAPTDTLAATTTSIQNTDTSDRWVTDIFANCQGDTTAKASNVGLANFNLKAATTSVANLGLQGNGNLAGNLNLATSTIYSANSSSTPTAANGAGAMLYLWKAGSYMTYLFNGTTTSSTSCIVGSHYLAS